MLTHHRALTERIIGAAIAVHRALGQGLLESAYEHCLLLELEAGGLAVRRQVPVDLVYREHRVEGAYRIDLLVEEVVVVEVKAVERMLPLHGSQVLTYVRLAGCKVGLLLNFNVDRLADGMKRVVVD
jgi:GxxExxY protein